MTLGRLPEGLAGRPVFNRCAPPKAGTWTAAPSSNTIDGKDELKMKAENGKALLYFWLTRHILRIMELTSAGKGQQPEIREKKQRREECPGQTHPRVRDKAEEKYERPARFVFTNLAISIAPAHFYGSIRSGCRIDSSMG